jgi:putative DNA primase/helicase
MSDHISAFIDHMRAVGCGPSDVNEIHADDTRRRYRLDGDKPKVRNGSYSLRVEPDGFAFGWCMSFKEGVTHSWHAKTTRKTSPEDRAAWKAKAVLAQQARDAAEKAARDAAAVKAKALWQRCDKAGQAGYLDRKGCALHGARVSRGLVVVPMYGTGGLVGLQFIAADGAKRFIKGAGKEGAYFPIADRGEVVERLLICEGFATAAALRVSLGWPVVAAFDAGNLKPVALAMREKYPAARIVIAADNDQWTTKPDGTKWNPGIEKAQQAAVAIGGAQVIAPDVPADDPDKRTDWDDVWRTDGPDAVKAAFDTPQIEWRAPDEDGGEWERDYMPPEAVEATRPFRCLGHDRGRYFFLPSRNGGQVVELSAAGLSSMSGLMQIHSSHDFWSSSFGDGKISDRQLATFAGYALADECHRIGVFRSDNIRGAGAWRDGDAIVVNDGTQIFNGARSVSIHEWRGQAIYEADRQVYDLDADPLGNTDASAVREICNSLMWANPLHGDLLAGWIVVAPFGSCLRWRPHVHLTGASGAGKSWTTEHVVVPLLGKAGLFYAGVTEPGIRNLIGRSGRPFVLDEAEAETKTQRENLQKVLHLMRKASSGASVATAYGEFAARSCFMLCSINSAVVHQADESRITQLMLAGDKRPDKAARFAEITERVARTITPQFAAALQARTMRHLDVLYDNEATFKAAAGAVFGRQRNADQLAPMIAGLYMLTSTARIDAEKAVQWIKARDWSWHQTDDTETDAHGFIRQLMTSRVRYDTQGVTRESTIGRMVEIAADSAHPAHAEAHNGLRSLGIKVDGGKLWVANKSPAISRIMQESSWTTWHRTLSDYPGADGNDNKPVHFATGLVSKCRRVPLDAILGTAAIAGAQDQELGLGDDWR